MVNEKRKAKIYKESHSEKIQRLYPDGIEYGTVILVEPPAPEELGEIIEDIEPVGKARTFGRVIRPPV